MPLCDCTKPSVGKDCLRYFLLPAYSYTYLQKLQKNLSQKPFFNMNKISSDICKIEVIIIYYVWFDFDPASNMSQQHIRHKSIFVVWIYRQLFIFGFHNKYQLSLQIHLEVFTKKLLNLKFNQSEQNGGKKVLTFHIYNFSHHQRPKVLYKWKV